MGASKSLESAVPRKSDGTELATATAPLRVDPTGTTAQPVTDNGGSLSVDDGGGSITVDGSLTASQGSPAGAAAPWAVRQSDGSVFIEPALEHVTAASPHAARLSDGASFYDAAKTGQLPAALVGGRLDVNTGSWLGSTAPTVGQKTMAGSLPVTLASDQAGLPAGTNRLGSVRLVDGADVILTVARGVAVPAGTDGIIAVGEDAGGVARALDVRVDSLDGRRRLQVEGKLTLTPPEPPPSTTKVTITFSGALGIASDQTDNYIITNGKRFVVQQIVAGCEGDTSERGSVVEVFYFDGTTEHLIERVYLNGFSTEVFPNTEKARDGANSDGNGTTKTIRVKRRRLSGSLQEVDFVVRGYEYTP
jgi:hypothetical protein